MLKGKKKENMKKQQKPTGIVSLHVTVYWGWLSKS